MKEEAKRSKTLRKFWKAKLQEWQVSDLTAPGWCRANQLPYHQFIYWPFTLEPRKMARFESLASVELT